MTNIWQINFGSYFSSNSIPNWQKIFSFGEFEIFKDCKNLEKELYIEELNIRNNPGTKNTKITSELFEGVKFFKEQYSYKEIRIRCSMFETPSKTIDDSIIEIKDKFESIKNKIEIYYRWELLYLTAILEWAIQFKDDNGVWYFEASFIWEPFFKSYMGRSVDWSISWTSWVVQLLNEGNRIFPVVRLKANGNAWGLSVWNSAWKVRYIRNSMNGSTANNWSHFVELKAFEKITWNNIALNKPVSWYKSQNSSKPYSRFTNGNTNAWDYSDSWTDWYNYLQVDLWSIYDIEKIQMWHYYTDSRKYHDNKLEVSVDWVQWTTLFDSNMDGEYKESSQGKIIYVEDKITNIDWKRTVIEDINNGDIIDFHFDSGKVLRNWLPVKTDWTLPVLKSNSTLSIFWINKENYPNLNQQESSYSWTWGHWGFARVNHNSNYHKVGHLFSSHSITNLKKISIWGDNEYPYSIELIFSLYTGTSKSTKIAEFSKVIYWGQYVSWSHEVNIDGYWLDISWYSDIYMEVYIKGLSAIPTSSTDYFRLYRTSVWGGTGKSYDSSMNVVDWNWDMKLEWYSWIYEPTYENVSSIDYEIEYYNNFL